MSTALCSTVSVVFAEIKYHNINITIIFNKLISQGSQSQRKPFVYITTLSPLYGILKENCAKQDV